MNGGYSSGKLLKSLPANVHYYGLIRSDAALVVFQAKWPRVTDQRVIQVVICQPVQKGFEKRTLFTTDLTATAKDVIAVRSLRRGCRSLKHFCLFGT
jgi:hypothetical protein